MTRVSLVDPNATTPERRAVLEEVKGAFGATPAMFRALVNSPAALGLHVGQLRRPGPGRPRRQAQRADRGSRR